MAPLMNSGRNKLIVDYNITDFFMMFWSLSFVKEGALDGPIDGPLWFIRDLMVMTIISPVLFVIAKKMPYLILFGLFIYISGTWSGIPGLSIVALVFFSLGAYFATNKFSFVEWSKDNFGTLSVFYISILTLLVLTKDSHVIPLWIHHFNVIVGVFFSAGLAAWISEKKYRVPPFLVGSTFFVFASHSELLKIFIRM